ncbi:hypothetical protein VTN77DRAFT_9473 [Rasamsonia byssochlamydoides]|uniref:uncharacterized protein n=1 Tax=Rasamsonia byssochlamydoides TaxID=89139 RepID=UPI003743E92A
MSEQYYQHSYSPQPSGIQQPPYGYSPNSGYQHPQGPYQPPASYQTGGAPEGFGPPRRQDSFGPPAVGGFQHGYEGGQFGAYDASNPQGHLAYYGGPPPDTRGYSPSPSLHQQHAQYDQNNAQYQQQPAAAGESAPVDLNAPEGERGLGSALLGGAAGYYIGHKHNHGLLGAVGGALLGNFIGDKLMDKKHHGHGHGHHHHHHHRHHGSHHGGSSWGGGW